MRKFALLICAIFLMSGCANNKQPTKPINLLPMKIESKVFLNNQFLPTKYTCDGTSVNPSLKIADVPAEAKSLVLIVDDPDAPSGDFVHWLVCNIDPKITDIEEGSVPAGGIQGTGSSGTAGYVPPCPPSGVHHYTFKLYALDTKLGLPNTTTKTELLTAMQGRVINETAMIGLYSRK